VRKVPTPPDANRVQESLQRFGRSDRRASGTPQLSSGGGCKSYEPRKAEIPRRLLQRLVSQSLLLPIAQARVGRESVACHPRLLPRAATELPPMQRALRPK
jgi:hypothetical protein